MILNARFFSEPGILSSGFSIVLHPDYRYCIYLHNSVSLLKTWSRNQEFMLPEGMKGQYFPLA